MCRTDAILATAALIVVAGLGTLAHFSSAFKDTGTTVGIVILGLLALTGLFGALAAPLLDAWITDPDTADHDPADHDTAAVTPDEQSLTPHAGSTQ